MSVDQPSGDAEKAINSIPGLRRKVGTIERKLELLGQMFFKILWLALHHDACL
jgi:hypothetical protein